ncbi:glutathione S-transferase family protein [Bradyrhizobium prioriisuperbiae]|uniref:glutathione S-transferase family protein n=1 Tax=Bradyrhizobium prioriisuperbiae TaxID=2854389 RepID=UPI0028F16E33|nr:glutathione S-transferase family protein [Bradyrhizobium prioritasuperba]
MLTLYNNAYSTCSQKVRLCLHEKALDWDDRQINFRLQEHLAPEYLKLNPNGVVPTLVHDGSPVVDSSVIMEYLDEVFPDTPMTPRDPVARGQMRAWMRYFEEVPTVAVRFPSFNQAFVRHFRELDETEFNGAADARPLRKHFFQQMGQQGFSKRDVRNALERFRNTAVRMDTALQDGRPWLLGDQLTIADACVAPLFDRMDDLGLAWLWERQLHTAGWLDRYRARPAYGATFYERTRLSSIYPDLHDTVPGRDLLEEMAP